MIKLDIFLDIYFRKISPDYLIQTWLKSKSISLEPCLVTFKNKIYEYTNNYNSSEINNMYSLMRDSIRFEDKQNKDFGVFNLLIKFSEDILEEKENHPVCKLNNLLKWSNMARKLGEDVFTTSYFAYKDFKDKRNRNNFLWNPIISSNDIEIINMFKNKNICDNHFHLDASAPNFSIAWVSLMNYVIDRNKEFDRIKIKQSPEYQFNFVENRGLYDLVKMAAYIRALIFIDLVKINGFDLKKSKFITNNFKYISELLENSHTLNSFIIDIQEEINSLRELIGLEFSQDEIPDYAINEKLDSSKMFNILLSGERFFLYTTFKTIFNEKYKYQNLFYIYLVIKSRLREELILCNNRIGFSNFKLYQDRKSIFIKNNSIYDKLQPYMSITTSIKNQNIKNIEARISLNTDREKLTKNIQTLDKYISANFSDKNESENERFLKMLSSDKKSHNNEHNHFYVLHFHKEYEKLKENTEVRNKIARENVKLQAIALSQLRKNLSSIAKRIFGIDAAGNESNCKPEVFAQAYRFLKADNDENNKKYKEHNIPNLKSTYHVGEEFLDVISGLRAIQECIDFLDLSKGDRIAHAIVLGIDVKEFYNLKKSSLIIDKQDILDNICWILFKCKEEKIKLSKTFKELLENKYNELFSYVYSVFRLENNVPKIDIYYKSILLRGDDPECYEKKVFKSKSLPEEWNKYSLVKSVNQDIRENKEISLLNHLYYFNPSVKKNGKELEQLDISSEYIKIASKLQDKLKNMVLKKQIAIETAPTSNVLIGTFRQYSKHPITNFYNDELKTIFKKIPNYFKRNIFNTTNISVSINTDDQGVFNTYLENEYALMAEALRKEGKYKDEEIYSWLEKIMDMGWEQSFKKN